MANGSFREVQQRDLRRQSLAHLYPTLMVAGQIICFPETASRNCSPYHRQLTLLRQAACHDRKIAAPQPPSATFLVLRHCWLERQSPEQSAVTPVRVDPLLANQIVLIT